MKGIKSAQPLDHKRGFVSQLMLVMLSFFLSLILQLTQIIALETKLATTQKRMIEQALISTHVFKAQYQRLDSCCDKLFHRLEFTSTNGYVYSISVDDNHQVIEVVKEYDE